MKKKIIATVTNTLVQDQRMIRICTTLVDLGFDVLLVGRQSKDSPDLQDYAFAQKRLRCIFRTGVLFYVEYNIRLFIYLFRTKHDIVYTVDTDTLIAGGMIKYIRGKKQIYDAHEYFTEVPELKSKPIKRWIWNRIEDVFVPKADLHITVSDSLAKIFSAQFQRVFHTIRNVPTYTPSISKIKQNKAHTIVYQGVLNVGRGLEEMIGAMTKIHQTNLAIIGEGDIAEKLRNLADQSPAKDRIHFLGWKSAEEMIEITQNADLGINLLDGRSKSYYYSLANKFFDYMHAGIPSVNMDYPEYRDIVHQHEVGILLSHLTPDHIAQTITSCLADETLMERMKKACAYASEIYNWLEESKKLGVLILELTEKNS